MATKKGERKSPELRNVAFRCSLIRIFAYSRSTATTSRRVRIFPDRLLARRGIFAVVPFPGDFYGPPLRLLFLLISFYLSSLLDLAYFSLFLSLSNIRFKHDDFGGSG